MFLVRCALRVLHITRHSVDNDPNSTDGCEEGPWNGAERVEIAAIDDPANQVKGDGSDGRLYER
jgi:hypothetical protein